LPVFQLSTSAARNGREATKSNTPSSGFSLFRFFMAAWVVRRAVVRFAMLGFLPRARLRL
jgi:hypothetical protein